MVRTSCLRCRPYSFFGQIVLLHHEYEGGSVFSRLRVHRTACRQPAKMHNINVKRCRPTTCRINDNIVVRKYLDRVPPSSSVCGRVAYFRLMVFLPLRFRHAVARVSILNYSWIYVRSRVGFFPFHRARTPEIDQVFSRCVCSYTYIRSTHNKK